MVTDMIKLHWGQPTSKMSN